MVDVSGTGRIAEVGSLGRIGHEPRVAYSDTRSDPSEVPMASGTRAFRTPAISAEAEMPTTEGVQISMRSSSIEGRR